MKLCALASGSTGNATFVSAGSTRILVDAGISVSQLRRRLVSINEYIGSIDAVLLTHEHLDHAGAVESLYKTSSFHGHVYMERQLHAATKKLASRTAKVFDAGVPFNIGPIEVRPLAVQHDAIAPVGFVLSYGMSRCAVFTDLGAIPAGFGDEIVGVDILLLESNHDADMLQVGPYAEHLRGRVLGDRGHLSNDQVAAFIRDEMRWGHPRLLLGHLSESNNDPQLVHLVASRAIRDRELNTELTVIEHGSQSAVLEC